MGGQFRHKCHEPCSLWICWRKRFLPAGRGLSSRLARPENRC
ncbi:hypothetical protein NY78_0590 [Desulfovibrio sp. TomC]|nr:hypothetical protein NY78_0590 [Desulfovibrio sp. TomC]